MSLPGVGVFGTGSATRIIVPLLRKEGFRIEALWGQAREEADRCAAELGIPFATSSVDSLLLRKDVDLVFILCPPVHHSQIAAKALGIGKHIAVQSPGGLNQDETLRIVQAAQYYPRLLNLVNSCMRFLPTFRQMRTAIASGYVGSVAYYDVRLSTESLVGGEKTPFSWLCDQTMGGGSLNLFGSQLIDLVYFLSGGQRAVRVHGVTRTLTACTEAIAGIRQITSDDCATIQLELTGGAFVNMTLVSAIEAFNQEVLVCGKDGYLVARNDILVGHKKTMAVGKEQTLFRGVDAFNCVTGDALLPRLYLNGLSAMLSAVATHFLSGKSDCQFSTFENAHYVQAVLEAIRLSAKERTWAKVSYSDW